MAKTASSFISRRVTGPRISGSDALSITHSSAVTRQDGRQSGAVMSWVVDRLSGLISLNTYLCTTVASRDEWSPGPHYGLCSVDDVCGVCQ